MGIGHTALAFASKKLAPRTSLGTLVLAGVFIDVLWGITVMLGLEHVRITPGITAASPLDLYDYPITHSLVGALGWAVAFAAVYLALRRERVAALVLGAGVLSHWLLDVVAHRPDVPVLPGGPFIGLGLWNSLAGTLVVEAVMVAAGLAVYLGVTRGRDAVGRWGILGLVAVLAAVHLGSYLGPPPPSVSMLPAFIAMMLLLVWLFHFVDRHRDPVAVAK